MRFTHLHTHSHYSLLDGLAKIDQLVNRAKELGMNSLALTDHGNLYGAVEFYKAAKAAGIKPILGVEAYVAPGKHTEKNPSEKYYHLILLAKNETGWKNLIQLVTKAHLYGFYYKPRIDKDLLREHSEGLIALSACLTGEVARSLSAGKPEQAEKVALEYEGILGKGNFYIEIGHHPGVGETVTIRDGLVQLSKKTGIPLAATQDIHYLLKTDSEYHDVLLAVQTGNKISDPDRLSLKDDDFSMTSPEEMAKFFQDIPEAVENTAKIADMCNFELKLGQIQLPKFSVPEGETANSYMRKLVEERIGKRYSEITPAIRARVDYEISVVEKMNFADYFLIVQDFVNWAKDHGIVVGPGRGSAAGSIIAYILRITNLDPIKYDLLFERFLNPDRIQMPDIDIDFTDLRRDEVFAYLTEKYGMDRVAHIITFGTMAARAAVRDVGRAMGISYSLCDQIAKMIPFNQDLEEAMESVPELKEIYKTNPDAKRILDSAKHLEGVARHASVHACGTVIGSEPLTNHLPIQRAPQDENVIITQFEMHSIEDLGLLKMDLLGLKNLSIIEEILRLVEEIRGEKIDIDKINLEDPATFKLLQIGDTTGVFQFESSGMRRYMKDIKPTELEDLIALVALYRPGPMDLIPTYIRRKHGQEQVSYLHPKLEPILKPTHGVGIYQEQMMRIARDLAGFTLAEADTLRKAIGKKIKDLLDKQQGKLVDGMIKNGIDAKTAQAIWELFPPFARYGFNRSHAACYAMIGYQTAYLKAHYPVESMTALMNADSGDTERIAFLVEEAKKSGINVVPPDVNRSSAMFTPHAKEIIFGLTAIKNLGVNIVDAIIEERQKAGPFQNLNDLLMRVQHKDLNKKSIEAMTKSGALDSLGADRAQVLANIEEIVKFSQAVKKQKQTSQSGLFGGGAALTSLRLKPADPLLPQVKLTWEKELLGLYISDHPLNHFKEKIEKIKAKPVKDALASTNEREPVRLAGIVSRVRHIITKNGKPMLFATVEDFTGSIEIVVFNETLVKTAAVWTENKVCALAGKISLRNGEVKVICDNAVEL